MGREHWVEVPLDKLCTIATGKRDVNEGNPNGRYLFFTCAQEPTKIDFYEFTGEAILIAGNGFFNVKIYNGDFNAYQRTYVLQNLKIYSKFIFNYLLFSLDKLTKDQRGTTVKYIRLGDVQNHLIPLPPLNEQKRIVEKLDAILPRVKSAKARLEKIPAILKKFRQSVLAAACSGRLTEDWREGKDLPEWDYVKAEDITLAITKGTTPKSDEILSSGPIPYLKVYNIVDQKIDFNYKPQFVTVEVHNGFLKRSKIYPGDVLMNIVGPPLGKIAIVTNDYKEWNINQAIAFFRPDTDKIISNYLYIVLCNGEPINEISKEFRGSAGQQNISLEQSRNFIIPLPPLEEQQEIVSRVEKLFALADSLEAKYQKALARVEKIEQSILAKAFRGEMVESDPNDEPAEELLKRILEEKAKLVGGKKMRKKRAAK